MGYIPGEGICRDGGDERMCARVRARVQNGKCDCANGFAIAIRSETGSERGRKGTKMGPIQDLNGTKMGPFNT